MGLLLQPMMKYVLDVLQCHPNLIEPAQFQHVLYFHPSSATSTASQYLTVADHGQSLTIFNYDPTVTNFVVPL